MSPGRDNSAAAALPPSVEAAYRAKCIQLRQRMQEVESANDELRLRRERLVRGIRKMRLERAILLEALSKRMYKGRRNMAGGEGADEDSEDSTDSPPTPQERPMRVKRSHRRPDSSFIHESTPSRPGASGAGGDNGSNRGGAGSEAGGPNEDGIDGKDEEMADAAGGGDGDHDGGEGSVRQSGEYGNDRAESVGHANNGDARSNADDSQMHQD